MHHVVGRVLCLAVLRLTVSDVKRTHRKTFHYFFSSCLLRPSIFRLHPSSSSAVHHFNFERITHHFSASRNASCKAQNPFGSKRLVQYRNYLWTPLEEAGKDGCH